MTKLVTVVCLCACVLLSGCKNSKELTRAKAAELVSKTYPRAVTSNFPIGRIDAGAPTMEAFLATPPGRMRKTEENDGVLTLKWEGLSSDWMGTHAIVRVDPTDKGKSYVLGKNPVNQAFMTMKMCEQLFNDITGIAMQDANHARVDYTWKLGNLTPFGKSQHEVLGAGDFSCNAAPPVAETVGMTLYDDGWRVAQ